MPPKPAQHCIIFTLQGCAPKACQVRDRPTYDLCSARPHSPNLSSQGSIDKQVLHFASFHPSGTPSPYSKGLLLHLS
jgi:hypothetical protein